MVSREWITVPLGKIATLQRGYDLPNRLRRPGAVPIITSSGIGGTHNAAMVSGPGVVTGRYGTIGEVFYIESDFWPLNTTLFVRDFHGNDPLFVSYLLRTIDFQIHSGKSGVPGVNRNDLHEVVVSVPPTKAEQEAIAEALSDADVLIESLEQLIAKKRQIKQGAMQELVTGKKRLPGFATKPGYKQTEVGMIPEDWACLSLNALVAPGSSITYGIVQAGPHVESGVPYIKTGDMSGRVLPTDGLSKTSREIAARYPRSTLRTGELVYSIRASVGAVHCVPLELDGANLTQGTARIAPNPNVFPLYLLNALRSAACQSWIDRNAKGSTYREITLETLRALPVPTPPTLAEQQAIAAILSDMDAEVTTLEEKLTKAHQLKQGMMQELLTGRIRLV